MSKDSPSPAAQLIPPILLFAVLLCLAPLPAAAKEAPQRAERGGIDLAEIDFSSEESLALEGQWLFFHRRFLEPESVPALLDGGGEAARNMPVPGFWDRRSSSLPTNGYGTYVLEVQLPPGTQELGIYVEGVHSAYSLYANGEKILSCGSPGRNRESYTARIMPKFTIFFVQEPVLYLVLHTANFRAVKSGLMQAPVLGTPDAVASRHSSEMAANLFVFGAILIMAIYYFGIHFFRRRDYTALFFSLFCLFIALRGGLTGARFILQMFPEHSYELLASMEFISAYLPALFFYLYFRHRYPDEEWPPFRYLTYAVLGFLTVSAVFMPIRYHSPLSTIFDVFVIVEVLVIIAGAVLAVRRRRPEAPFFLLGFALLSAAILQDVLYFHMIMPSKNFMLEYGLVAFILIHSFTLAKRYTRFERQAKRYAENLENENTLLEKRYAETSRQLEYTRHTLNTAQRRDFLTGLPNLRALEERIEREGRERTDAARFGLLSVVPDRFDQLESEGGRSQRDIILLQLAALLEERCERRAAVFRGEEREFLLLFPDTSREEISSFMDEIREGISAGSFTVSAGAALQSRETGMSLHPILERARETRREAEHRAEAELLFSSRG